MLLLRLNLLFKISVKGMTGLCKKTEKLLLNDEEKKLSSS